MSIVNITSVVNSHLMTVAGSSHSASSFVYSAMRLMQCIVQFYLQQLDLVSFKSASKTFVWLGFPKPSWRT